MGLALCPVRPAARGRLRRSAGLHTGRDPESVYFGRCGQALSDSDLEPYLAPWIGPIGQPAFYRQIAQMDQRFTDEVEPLYGQLRCPVALLWGKEDRWIPPDSGHRLAAMLPGCDLTLVPGSGHLMQEDKPEAVVAAALRFFAG